MDIHYGFDGLNKAPSAVAIGVFDGVHLGHQAVLSGAASMGRALGHRAVALTFDVNPAVVLAPERAPSAICTIAQRSNLIDRYGGGIDAVVIVHFDRKFAALSPDDFVRDILVNRLSASHVFVGHDFRYGHDRAGDGRTLAAEGEQFGFAVDVVEPVVVDGERVSSTRIRSLVREGDIPAANRLLGHDFAIAGKVVAGKKLGREIGFPTANLSPAETRQLLPVDGVYAGFADLVDGRSIRAAISVGTNPTTDVDGARKVEAYLMDGFDEDIYDTDIAIRFRRRLRGQVEFKGLDGLIERIRQDVEEIDRTLPIS